MRPPDEALVSALAKKVNASFGAAVRQLRIEAGLTQSELSRRSRCSRDHLCAVERGRRSGSAVTFAKVQAALGVDLVDFLVHVSWHAMSMDERREMFSALASPPPHAVEPGANR